MLELVRIIVLLAIATLYAVFDVFNKREVPNVFVYACLAIGILVTFTYGLNIAEISLLIALAIGAGGYLVYRAGYWGAGDFFELATISLLVPIQPAPLLNHFNQLGLPFIVSVFIAAGFAAVWIVPLYYLIVKRNKAMRKTKTMRIYKFLGILLFVLYLLLLLFAYVLFGVTWDKLAIIALIGVPSAITLAYEEEITSNMVERIYPSRLEAGDIIAVNIMQRGEIKYFKSKYAGFGRLATGEMISKLKNVRKKLPVYKHAAPLTVFVLIGIVVSLLFGNIVLYLLY